MTQAMGMTTSDHHYGAHDKILFPSSFLFLTCFSWGVLIALFNLNSNLSKEMNDMYKLNYDPEDDEIGPPLWSPG